MPRTLVAISGGVDSSVAALLLKQQGHEVVCVHMHLYDDAPPSDRAARAVAEALEAPYHLLDLRDRFETTVIADFVSEYRQGHTPNPCALCNPTVKWNALLEQKDRLACDYIATGHYVRLDREEKGRWPLRRGRDPHRDQSYFLWRLSQEALAHTLFPLGDRLKSDVRALAREHGLHSADRAESREICFIPDNDYKRFLTDHEGGRGRGFEPGEIVLEDGTMLGQHPGTAFYTVGQRKGLGIAHPTPLYVLRTEPESRRVIVGPDDSLLSREMVVCNVNWVSTQPPGRSGSIINPLSASEGRDSEEHETGSPAFDARVKIRYQHPAAAARVEVLTDGSLRVIFAEAQRAITPGQSAVIYDGDLLLAGGIIAPQLSV